MYNKMHVRFGQTPGVHDRRGEREHELIYNALGFHDCCGDRETVRGIFTIVTPNVNTWCLTKRQVGFRDRRRDCVAAFL